MYERALAVQRRVLGERHANTLNTQFQRGTLSMKRGDYARARADLEAASEGLKATLGEDHVDWARYTTALGECLTRLGRYPEAKAALEAAYDSAVRTRPPADPQARGTAGALAALYEAEGDAAGAEAWRAKARH